MPEAWRDTVLTVLRQRLRRHEHPEAVADALQRRPALAAVRVDRGLGAIEAPTVVVADRDEADPGHPLAIGEAYARTIPGARARRRGGGQVADRLAGQPAVEVIADVAGRV